MVNSNRGLVRLLLLADGCSADDRRPLVDLPTDADDATIVKQQSTPATRPTPQPLAITVTATNCRLVVIGIRRPR
jgi:hypothetical protein